jgi:tol-pal system protein YbgF
MLVFPRDRRQAFARRSCLIKKPKKAMSRISLSALKFATLALLVTASLAWPALAQQDGEDPEIRIEQLEARLRQLTGQNEELQYRNRQLEEQLKQLQGGQGARPNVAMAPQPQPQAYPSQPTYPQPNPQSASPPAYPQPQSAPVEQARVQPAPSTGRGRGDAFDPSANPNAPGAPRPLGSIVGQPSAPLAPQAAPDVGAPGGRGAGEPLDLANTNSTPRGVAPGQPAPQSYPQQGYPQQGAAPQQAPAGPQVATLPPTNSPRDEYDLGYGYIERKDYAQADQTLRGFLQKYPSDRLVPEANYWLGESLYQRQRYRDAAESFLTVTTKFENSAKAPDALLRLGQSLAALKEKEAACAAFGEVTRKYPKASAGVKQGVDREQKRVHC